MCVLKSTQLRTRALDKQLAKTSILFCLRVNKGEQLCYYFHRYKIIAIIIMGSDNIKVQEAKM